MNIQEFKEILKQIYEHFTKNQKLFLINFFQKFNIFNGNFGRKLRKF